MYDKNVGMLGSFNLGDSGRGGGGWSFHMTDLEGLGDTLHPTPLSYTTESK